MVTYDLLGGELVDNKFKLPRPAEHFSSQYTDHSEIYTEHCIDYRNQYCNLYFVRLKKMIDVLRRSVEKKWGSRYPIIKLHKLQEEQRGKCVVIGTLYKDQKLKPSLLKKIAEANSLVPPPIYTHFTDNSDTLFIEDELQRYEVIGDIDIHKLVTGISCALLGTDQGMGKFVAEDFCFAECRAQIEKPRKIVDDSFICLISGLDLVNYSEVILPLKLFIDWLMGLMGNEETQEYVKKITRLIIAGDSVRSEAEVKKQISMVAKVVESNDTLNAVKKLDIILSQFARCLDVDIMPGQYDPSNHLLAQQPMHRCMFPTASKFKKLRCVPNPYECEIDGLRCLGTSGQPVADIMNYTTIETPIEALERCILWNHIAPTCPDTLGSYPYDKTDPFVIQVCPNIFFAGNQPKFETKLYIGPEHQRIRLICVPQFSRTFSVVLVNINTIECFEVGFGVENLNDI